MRRARFARFAVIGATAVIIGACAAIERAPEEPPALDQAPSDGTISGPEAPAVTIDPGSFGGVVEAVRVEARPLEGENALGRIALQRRVDVETDSPMTATERVRFRVPLEGLEDRRRYRFEFVLLLGGDREHRIEAWRDLELAFGVPTPEPTPVNTATLARSHELRWNVPDEPTGSYTALVEAEINGGTAPSDPARIYESADAGGTFTPASPWVDRSAFSEDVTLRWRVRLVHRLGVVGRWSRYGEVVFDAEEATPTPRTHAEGRASIVSTPGLSWSETAGVRYYRVELALEATGATLELRSRRAALRLEPADLDALFAEGSGEIVRWRVAAFGDDGLQTPFSPAVRFTYRPTVSGMQPVLRPGADAGLVLGSAEGGEADERPAATVQLDTPYEMMRYPLTNAAVVELANQQIAAGEWRLLEGGVVDAASGRRVVGLGDLTFGRQFAIQADGDGVRVVAGYAAHPAVGVSWYGAVLIANELSIREARTPVYEVVPDTDIPPAVAQRTEENGVIDVPDPSLLQRTEQPQAEDLSQGDPREIVDDAPAEVVYGVGVRSTRSADGYRLPHEAEWALAVSLEQSIPAGAEVTVPEARTVDGPELQGVNYLRSGDRWEDPTPPYTDQGGPTSPVGALGWSYAGGVYDLIGNVWEWTADWYSPTWYERLAGADGPTGAERVLGPRAPEPDVYGRELRAVRGTAWNTPRESVRPGNRGGFDPSATSHSIGVRLVRTIRPRRDPAEER